MSFQRDFYSHFAFEDGSYHIGIDDDDALDDYVDDGNYHDDADDDDVSMRQGRSLDLTVESTCGRLTTRRWGR